MSQSNNTSTLFSELMALCAEPDSTFYHVDHQDEDGFLCRIFLYRLSSYSDFQKPSALESRGITFRFNGGWSLISRPMEKFFNLNENPLTMGIDFSTRLYSTVKEDGSLISSYTRVTGDIALKSKGSLNSNQAVDAITWLKNSVNAEYYRAVKRAELDGWTVNFEWTSPLNRIVVSYSKPALIVLNCRNRINGRYMDYSELQQRFGKHVVAQLDLMPDQVKVLEEGEGVVTFFGNTATPRFIKIKADAYLKLHKLKDGVTNPGHLFDAVVYDTTDDIKALFATDAVAQCMIETMEQLVGPLLHSFTFTCRSLYDQFKHLERREFAIKMKEYLQNMDDAQLYFGICMQAKAYDKDLEECARESFLKNKKKSTVAQYEQWLHDKIERLGLANTADSK